MLVCAFSKASNAYETAGAARTRSSPRPLSRVARALLVLRADELENLGRTVSRECGRVSAVIARESGLKVRRHCEPTGPAPGRPDDRLREAIQCHKGRLDCFVRYAPRNDDPDEPRARFHSLHVGEGDKKAPPGGGKPDGALGARSPRWRPDNSFTHDLLGKPVSTFPDHAWFDRSTHAQALRLTPPPERFCACAARPGWYGR